MDKLRYMISDAASLVNVEAHVLRYWEEELELDIPRNEMGHRYYTKENIQQFLKIKELKEQGYQLKAIKMVVHHGKNPEEAVQMLESATDRYSMTQTVTKTVKAESSDFLSAEDKMQQFRQLMTGIVKEALEENNRALGKEVGESVGDRVLKEMNYLMREQEEQEEERYRKLDAAIRELHTKHSRKAKVKKEKKVKESRGLFGKREVTV
ncbi:MAG: MerR family transcriptional regulator [Lachnospiraceae bacterium]|nr:MerR family transcriptional regulator [Lachnospiraceae bacterium]